MGVTTQGGGPPGDRFRSFILKKTYYDEVQLIPLEAHSTIDEANDPNEEYLTWYSGTPTTPGNILNANLWENSNKNIFMLKCGSCNHWNAPTVKTNIQYRNFDPFGELHPEFSYPLDERNRIEDAYLGCEECGKSIEHLRGRLGNFGGEGATCWVPQVTAVKKDLSGYFMTQLILGLKLHSVKNILTKLQNPNASKRKKYNEVLGYAHVGEDSPFSMEAMRHSLMKNLSFSDFSLDLFDFYFITIDWGKPSWYSVHGLVTEGKRSKIFLLDIGHTHNEDERKHGKELNKRLSRKWKDAAVVLCDHGYSTNRERDLYHGFTADKVYTIDANVGAKKSLVHEHLNIDAKHLRGTHILKASRDFMLETFEGCLDQYDTAWFCPYSDPYKKFDGMELEKYLLHCSNVYRQPYSVWKGINAIFEEIKTEKTAYYKDAGSPDHSLMLFSYAALLTHPKIKKLLVRQAFQIM